MLPDLRFLIERLVECDVRFVIIGGVALVLRGSARTTQDLDLCYAREPEDLLKLEKALSPCAPTLRGAPPGLPFQLDAPTVRAGLNFTLSTSAGDLDILGEISGIGGYHEVDKLSTIIQVFGHPVKVLSLEGLKRAKRAAGRLKDLVDLAEIAEIEKREC